MRPSKRKLAEIKSDLSEAVPRKSQRRKKNQTNPKLTIEENKVDETSGQVGTISLESPVLLLDIINKKVRNEINLKKRETNERNISQKKFDSIAKILEGNSKCVAVAFINGKFLIAANEITQGSDENRIIDLIKMAMRYFSDLAHLKENQDFQEEKLLTKMIFNASILASQVACIYPEDELVPQIQSMVQDELNGKGLNHREFIKKFRKYASYVGKARAAFVDIIQDFLKLKNSLSGQGDAISKSQLDAFKLEDGYLILQEQPERTHAEVQILAEIVKLVEEGRVQFKKGAHLMFEVTNIVFESNEIPLRIKYAGEHNLNFDWLPPQIFMKGFYADQVSSKKQKSIPFIIGFLTANRIAELGLDKKKKGKFHKKEKEPVSMVATPSPSQAKMGIDERIKRCTHLLNQELEIYSNGLRFNSHLEKSIKLVTAALNFLNSEKIKYVLAHTTLDKQRLMSVFKSLSQQLFGIEVNFETLLLFLATKNIFDESTSLFIQTSFSGSTVNYQEEIETSFSQSHHQKNPGKEISPSSRKRSYPKKLFDEFGSKVQDEEQQQLSPSAK